MNSHNRKKILIIFIIVLILILGGIMIFSYLFKKNKTIEINPETNLPVNIETAVPVLFESLEISMQGMSAMQSVVKAGKTETGAYLEYFLRAEHYNSESGNYDEIKQVIRRVEGDAEYYNTLCKLFGVYNVVSWDGFVGKNPPGVLDGESGSFEAVLSDGRTIRASGSNNFPSNFTGLYSLLINLATVVTVSDTTVSNDYFSVTVPSEWIGVVKVSYEENMLVFFLENKEGRKLNFLIFDYNSYWLDADKCTRLGILRQPGANTDYDLKIVARKSFSLESYLETLTDSQKPIATTFARYEQSIIDSFRGINGYQLFPEE